MTKEQRGYLGEWGNGGWLPRCRKRGEPLACGGMNGEPAMGLRPRGSPVSSSRAWHCPAE